jgi:hypothetical protein
MTTSADLLSQGWQLHQASDLAGAEKVYRQVIAAEPANANAWCYLGIALFDTQPTRRVRGSLSAGRGDPAGVRRLPGTIWGTRSVA